MSEMTTEEAFDIIASVQKHHRNKMTMVEKVARAICLAELPTDDKWRLCTPAALAAIKAMREPTATMERVVAANWGRRTWEQYGEVIDAALNEDSAI